MSNPMPAGETRRCFSLPAIMDLTSVTSLKMKLEEAVGAGPGLDIDASAVQRVTSPCLQVLVAAFVKFHERNGQTIALTGASPEFTETVTTLALDRVLQANEV